MKKLLIGILVSAVFLYFSFRGVDYREIFAGLADVRFEFVVPAIMLLLLASVLRSLRWRIVLSPIEKIALKTIYPVTCVGNMAIVLIPMRMGEFVRPYLITVKSRIPLSSSFASVFLERVLDIAVLFGIVLFLVLHLNLPPWLITTVYTILPTFIVLVGAIWVLYFKTEHILKYLHPIFNRLPKKLQTKTTILFRTFVEGFQVLSNPKRFAVAILLTILVWGCSGLAIYSLFYFQNFRLSIVIAYVVLVVNILGISLPTAPGMVGNFQFGCILALSFFHIQKNDAFFFSMVYYFLVISINFSLGLIFLPSMEISYQEIKKRLTDFYGNTMTV